MLEYLFFYVEILALLVGLFYLNKISDSPIRYLIYLLVFVLITEAIGLYFRKVLHKGNAHFYNILIIIEFTVYYSLFKYYLKNRYLKKMINYLLYGFPIVSMLNMIFIQRFLYFATYSAQLGAIITIILCCIYFRQLLTTNSELDLAKEPFFWISTGLLFFYFVGFFNEALISINFRISLGSKEMSLYKIINNILVIILYTNFIIAFRCFRSKKI